MQETAADLAVALAVVSSYTTIPVRSVRTAVIHRSFASVVTVAVVVAAADHDHRDGEGGTFFYRHSIEIACKYGTQPASGAPAT